VTNPALAGLTGLPAGVTARGPSALEDPSLAGLSGLAPVRATGGATARGSGALEDPSLAGLSGLAPARALAPRALKEELDVVGRSSSVGRGASIPDVEHHSSIPNFDGPSENESNILFVDCLPTDCTRREVARILPAYYCPASYFFIFVSFILQALTSAGRFVSLFSWLQGHQSSAQGTQTCKCLPSQCIISSLLENGLILLCLNATCPFFCESEHLH
jgi:hypothetical protein